MLSANRVDLGSICFINFLRLPPLQDITINIGKNEKVPEPLAGHKWKAVVHKSDVTWIAGWSDPLTGKGGSCC